MPRFTFYQLFKLLDENTIEFLKPMKVGKTTFDEGARITRGTLIGGVDLFGYADLTMGTELEADDDSGTLVLKKIIYRTN